MVDSNTIDAYLAHMSMPYKSIADNTWLIDDEGDEMPPIAVALDNPVIVFSCRVVQVPKDASTNFYRTLLSLNATEMTAGAYGLDSEWVVVTETLQSENLDYNEFQGAVDGIVMSLTSHYKTLRDIRG